MLYRLLLWLGWVKPPTMVCMRQEETWCWPAHLGKKTEGTCADCGAPIYFEEQNAGFRKICNHCGMF